MGNGKMWGFLGGEEIVPFKKNKPSSPATNQNGEPLEGEFSITRFCPQANLEKWPDS